MSVFRPPPEYFYKKAVRAYERKFRHQVPQWVLTLGDRNIQTLVTYAVKLNWKLPTRILVAGEAFSGSASPWSDQKTRLDHQTEFAIKQRPLNLMNLPADPAKAMASSLESRKTILVHFQLKQR